MPLKYNAKLHKRIIETAKVGGGASRCALAAGISPATLRIWLDPFNEDEQFTRLREEYAEARVTFLNRQNEILQEEQKDAAKYALEQLKALDPDYGAKLQIKSDPTDHYMELIKGVHPFMSVEAFTELKIAFKKFQEYAETET
jgi:hypothetical protein